MDIRALRHFLAVAGEGSVSGAARAVGVAQPSLSRQVRRLEEELEVQLFSRERGRLALTPAGRAFVPLAEDVVSRFDQAIAVIREGGRVGTLVLTVAANITTIDDILAPFAATRRGQVLLDLHADATTHLNALVVRGEADLVISAMPAATARLESVMVRAFPIYCCVPPSHHWAAREHVQLNELLGEPLIVLDQESIARHVFDEAVAQEGASYEAAYVVRLAQAGQALAASGHGVAIVTDESRFGLACVPVAGRDGPLTLPLFATWDRLHYAKDRIVQLVEQLRDFCAQPDRVTAR